MKNTGKLPILIVAVLAWIVIISSCANPGMPEGGYRDTIPPVLLKTDPVYKSVNNKNSEVRLTFNEYLSTEEISEELVVSPPMVKKPSILTKSKTLIIKFNEELKDSTTYSLDFKSSLADNNEKNIIEDFRYSFSTGPVFDSLRVSGHLANSFNQKPIEKGLVLLHSNLHDSAIFKVRPDYIAKTDEEGKFLIDNIAPGKYHIFALNDANNNLQYNEGAEEIAFYDSIVVPSAVFEAEPDTIRTEKDTIVVLGHTHFSPEPIFLSQFTEDLFEQFLETGKRDSRYKCTFVFGEPVKDTFALRLLNYKTTDNWYQIEYNEKFDSLSVWITDTLAAKVDTLMAEVAYFQLDSMDQVFLKKDTVELAFLDLEKERAQKKKKDKDETDKKTVEQFSWQTDLTGSTVELNKKLGISTPEPLFTFDETKIKMYLSEDTLKTPLKFSFEKDTTAYRKYLIGYKWLPGTTYSFEIDSAAAVNIYGITSRKFSSRFSSREEDFYGSLELDLSNVEMPLIVQLCSNSDEEKVVAERFISKNGKILFDYLLPEKYRVKLIYDSNGNGTWDTGSFQDNTQPEKVIYLNQVHKVRSNWDESLIWDVKPDHSFVKNIRDFEQEEKARKEAEEKAKKAKEGENRQQMQDFMQGSGTGLGF
jgi:hypothetical protein